MLNQLLKKPSTKKDETRTTQANGRHPADNYHGPQGQVLILIGGSGAEVGRQVLADEQLSQREDVSLGFIDGDREGLADLPADLRYVLDDVPAHDLAEEIKRNPAAYPGCELLGDIDLERSLPHGTDNLNGASEGKRFIGQFQFSSHVWRYFSLVIAFLLSRLQTILKVKTDPVRIVKHHTDQILVVVSMVVSACGGTGSALLVLVQDLLRHLSQYNLGVSRLEFQAHIVLSSVFLGKAADMQALLAKTYAFFIELLARYERIFPPIRFGPIHLARNRAPFAWVYLYDTINQRDRLLTSRQQIAEVIKYVWEYINFGPLADRYRALKEHVRSEGRAIFSAAGIAGVEFPVGRVKRQGTFRTGLTVLETLVAPDPQSEIIAEQLFQDFLRQHPDFYHLPDLRLDIERKPLTLSYRHFAANLDQVPRQHLVPALENVTTKLVADSQKRLEQICEQEKARLGRQLLATTQKILSRPQGLQIATHFLIKLDRHFTEPQLGLSQQITRSNEELEGQRRVVQTIARGRLTKLTLKARSTHIQGWHKLANQAITLHRQGQQYQLFTSLRDQISTLRQDNEAMARALTELAQRLLAAERRYLQQQQARSSVVFQSLLDDDAIDQLVNERVAEISQSALEGIGFTLDRETGLTLLYHGQNRGLDRWFLVSAEGVEEHLNYCEQFWGHLDRECSVEGFLRTQGEDIGLLIEELQRRATPWVAVNRAKQMPAENRLLLLGTETGTEFVSDPPGYINVAATGDKSRLVLLYTIHGLDVMNLEQAPAWRDAYEQAIAQGKRLHVVPEVDPLNPANGNNKQ